MSAVAIILGGTAVVVGAQAAGLAYCHMLDRRSLRRLKQRIAREIATPEQAARRWGCP